MKTIVWDVDDVLNNLMQEWFEKWWLPSRKDCPIQYNQIKENPPCKLLGINNFEYLTSLDEFRLSDLGKNMAPIPEVLTWFHQHGECCRHIALTSTPLKTARISAAWVMRHFGFWIRSFNFVPSLRENDCFPVYDASKQEYLRWWGRADILVEDDSRNADAARTLGIETIIIPRPWNSCQATIAEALAHLSGLVGL